MDPKHPLHPDAFAVPVDDAEAWEQELRRRKQAAQKSARERKALVDRMKAEEVRRNANDILWARAQMRKQKIEDENRAARERWLTEKGVGEKRRKKLKNRMWVLQSGTCMVCMKFFPAEKLEIDHVHPKSKGGRDHISNYQLLCRSCNASKGSKFMQNFLSARNKKVREEWRQRCKDDFGVDVEKLFPHMFPNKDGDA